MAKTVNFDGKLVGVNKEYQLVDSPRNIKKVVAAYKKILDNAEASDGESYSDAILEAPDLADVIAGGVADLLNLTDEQKNELEDYSFADQYGFFNECLAKFLGMKLPSDDDEEVPEKKEDPKPQADVQSGN